MPYDATGTLYWVGQPRDVTSKLTKLEFVLEIKDGKYAQLVQFELLNDKVAEMDSHREGDEVKVSFDLRGREWKKPGGESRYFNSLNAWRVEGVGDVRSRDRRGGGRNSREEFHSSASSNDEDIPF
jgi:single-strand DNA-binding protein